MLRTLDQTLKLEQELEPVALTVVMAGEAE
jgi:hypothetical protein